MISYHIILYHIIYIYIYMYTYTYIDIYTYIYIYYWVQRAYPHQMSLVPRQPHRCYDVRVRASHVLHPVRIARINPGHLDVSCRLAAACTPSSHSKNSATKICSKGWVAQKPFLIGSLTAALRFSKGWVRKDANLGLRTGCMMVRACACACVCGAGNEIGRRDYRML